MTTNSFMSGAPTFVQVDIIGSPIPKGCAAVFIGGGGQSSGRPTGSLPTPGQPVTSFLGVSFNPTTGGPMSWLADGGVVTVQVAGGVAKGDPLVVSSDAGALGKFTKARRGYAIVGYATATTSGGTCQMQIRPGGLAS